MSHCVSRAFVGLATVWAAITLGGATSAGAGTITVEFPDVEIVAPGFDYTITVTVETVGTEVANPFDSIFVQVGWDSSSLQVENAGVSSTFGNAMQVVTEGPGAGTSQMTGIGTGPALFSGPPNPFCSNEGDVCTIVTQVNATLEPVTLDAQTLVGTLVLEGIAIGPPGFYVANVFDLQGQMDVIIVPEPGTAALLGLGLVTLAGHAGARRSHRWVRSTVRTSPRSHALRS